MSNKVYGFGAIVAARSRGEKVAVVIDGVAKGVVEARPEAYGMSGKLILADGTEVSSDAQPFEVEFGY